jgi:hypothetical protein
MSDMRFRTNWPSTLILSSLATFLELPRVDASGAGDAKVYAAVLSQVLGRARRRAAGKISGRGDGKHAQRRPDPHRHHVPGQRLAEPDAGVVSARDDVGEAGLDVELDLDLGIVTNQPVDGRPQDGRRGMLGGGDADRACRPLAQLRQGGEPLVDVVDRRPERLEQALAGLGRRHAACRSRQQPQPEPGLEPPDRVAKGRLG